MSNWTPENPFLNTDDLKEYAQYILGLAESDNPDMPDSFYDWAMSTSEEKVGISTLFGYEGSVSRPRRYWIDCAQELLMQKERNIPIISEHTDLEVEFDVGPTRRVHIKGGTLIHHRLYMKSSISRIYIDLVGDGYLIIPHDKCTFVNSEEAEQYTGLKLNPEYDLPDFLPLV